MNKRWVIAGVAVALAATFAGGMATTSARTVEVEKVVEKPVPGPERIVTKTVTVEKPVTPQACLTFITLADQLFQHASESVGIGNDAIQAAAKQDVAGLTAAVEDMKALSPKLQALVAPVNAARKECRGY